MTNSTNIIQNVFPGITLNLQAADETKAVNLVVTRDTQTAQTAIQDFVDAYNAVLEYIDAQTRFEPVTGEAGTLIGNSVARDVQRDLRNELSRVLPNLPAALNRLSSAGIQFDDTGRLQIDQGRLGQALQGELDGVSADDIRRLFTLDGQSTDTNIRFVSGSSKTKASTNPYDVVITVAAEKGQITAGQALAPSTTLTDPLSFVVNVDGTTSETLEIQAGTYTPDELSAALQSAINNSTTLRGRKVAVSLTNDTLTIESQTYGSSSEVTLVSGDFTDLGFTSGQSDHGRDVAGYFVVDGQTELASGKGRILTANSENANTSGIQLSVSLTASQITGSHQSELTVTRGFAHRLDEVIDKMLDSDHGRMKNADDGFQRQIDALDKSSTRLSDLFDIQQTQLEKEFALLESTISSLQTTSSFLGSQLANVGGLLSQQSS